MFRKSLILLSTVVSFAFIGTTLYAGEKEHREHEKHEHGQGELSVVLDGKELHLEFKATAMDIVGFGHEAKSPEEKKKVEEAIATLQQGDKVLTIAERSKCVLFKSSASNGHEEEEHHEEEGHHEEEEHHEDEHHEESEHSDFHASYQYTCGSPEKLEKVTVNLFELFPTLEEVDAKLIIAGKQRSMELSHKDSEITMKACRFGIGSWCIL